MYIVNKISHRGAVDTITVCLTKHGAARVGEHFYNAYLEQNGPIDVDIEIKKINIYPIIRFGYFLLRKS